VRSKQSGTIMIFTLAVLTAVVAVLASAAAMQRLAFRAQLNRSEHRKAELVAESGIQRALASLASQKVANANQNDEWYTLGNTGNDRFLLDDGSFRMQIVDAGSLVNLNSATQQQLTNLPLTTDQVDALLDWRSTGAQARPQGAKDQYYNTLSYPYNTAEKSLQSIDELLLVKGFTPATLYNTQQTSGATPTALPGSQQDQPTLYQLVTVDSLAADQNPQGQPKVNINTANLQQMVRAGLNPQLAVAIRTQRNAGTFRTIGDVLRVRGAQNSARAILDNFTITSTTPLTGKINLNTVTQSVLNTIPNLPTDVAQGIISRQSGTGFASLGEVTTVPGMSSQVLQQTADLFTTSSEAFVVRVIGTAGDTSVPMEALITLKNGSASISKLLQPPYNDMRSHWNWQDDPTNDVDLSSGQSTSSGAGRSQGAQ
jgi:type II secretory pathway component PulK